MQPFSKVFVIEYLDAASDVFKQVWKSFDRSQRSQWYGGNTRAVDPSIESHYAQLVCFSRPL